MVKLRNNRMWVMATSPKNYIALFSFQTQIGWENPMVEQKISGVGTLDELKTGL